MSKLDTNINVEFVTNYKKSEASHEFKGLLAHNVTKNMIKYQVLQQ
jgi:hypothetical protein